MSIQALRVCCESQVVMYYCQVGQAIVPDPFMVPIAGSNRGIPRLGQGFDEGP